MRMIDQVDKVSVISLEGRWAARLQDGRRVFVKASASLDDGAGRAERDRVCLAALAGLAVPRRIVLPPGCRPEGVGARCVVAEEWVPGAPLDHAGLSRSQLLGAWAFVAEQLVAFRRRQVLYTDVKCRNVLARRDPFTVTLIDFDFATAVEAGDRYNASEFGLTPGFEAPEQVSAAVVRESAAVYQLGMLLLHCWTGADNGSLRDRRGLPRLERDLRRLGAGAAAALARSCLEPAPSGRPRGYEAVLRFLRAPGTLPQPALQAWRRLRAPYERALGELRLEAGARR